MVKKKKRTAAETARVLQLKEGNISRTLSLNAENYNLLQRKALVLSLELERRVSASELVDLLIEGYVGGRIKLTVL